MDCSLQDNLKLVASLELLFFFQSLHDCLVYKLADHFLLHFGFVFIDHLALQKSSLADVCLVELFELLDEAE